MKLKIFYLQISSNGFTGLLSFSISKIDSYTAEMVEVNGVSIPIGRDTKDVIEGL